MLVTLRRTRMYFASKLVNGNGIFSAWAKVQIKTHAPRVSTGCTFQILHFFTLHLFLLQKNISKKQAYVFEFPHNMGPASASLIYPTFLWWRTNDVQRSAASKNDILLIPHTWNRVSSTQSESVTEKDNESAMCDSRASEAILVVVGFKLQFWQEICEQSARPSILTKAGIFDAGFGEI